MRLTRIRGLLAMLLHGAAALAAGEPLPFAAPQAFALQPGEEREFAVPAPDGFRGLRIVAVEHDIDLTLRWQFADRTLASDDGDFLRTGEHLLAASVEPGQGGVLRVRSTRLGSRGGRFALQAQWLDLTDEPTALGYSADLLETEIAQRIGDRERSGRPDSVDAARQLQGLRRKLGDQAGEIRALFMLDALMRRQGRRVELIALHESSLSWLRRSGNPVAIAAAYNNIGMSHWRRGDGRRAEAPLRQALAAFDGETGSLFRAIVDSNLCLVVASRRGVDASLKCSLRNLQLSVATGDYARIAVAWNNLAGAYSLAGRSEQAAQGYLKAMEFGERSEGRAVADPQMNLGLERVAQGRYEEARELYARAEAIYRREDNQRNLALVLRHRGKLDLMLGNAAEGERSLREALAAQRRVGSSEDVVRTLMLLGELDRQRSGTVVPAAYAEAVALAEVDADPQTLAAALLRYVPALADAGQFEAAQTRLARAQELADSLGNDYLRCKVLLQRARVLLARQQAAEALKHVRQALRMARAQVLAVDLAEIHAVEAQALTALRRPREAAEAYARGIDRIERARVGILDAEARARFVATRRDLYEGQAVVLAEDALARDDEALRRESLVVVAEQRSRSLLEEIESGAVAAAPTSAEYRQLATRELDLASARWLARERGVEPVAIERMDEELRGVSSKLAALERSGRAATPQSREMAAIVESIARETAIVHYLVAAEHSYAWVAAGADTRLVRLPGRVALERLVAAARTAVAGVDGASGEYALAELCRAVWAPLRASLRAGPVLVIPDGPLYAVPWPALACGGDAVAGAGFSLLDDVEIELSPSLRVVDEIRRRRERRSAAAADSPLRVLAVVDPVYARDDARLDAAARAAAVPSSALPTLSRLVGSAREAATLRSQVAGGEVTVLEGLQATRDAFVALPLDRYRLIHLGMHGFMGTASLADSGIAFSLLDAAGRSVPGFLNARSIARLDLDADLVVLAACESAAGAAVSGEGVLGTHYAFLAAGADQVIAAVAPVPDAATSRLMEALYRQFVREHVGAARALRMAQREIRRHPQTRDPRHWAGFVVYGYGASTGTTLAGWEK
ncbi:MAG TPA: CHAT domain-containing tetratricopeptide repeat protein [Tahibacter sp.]|nr:CHAT domain-containing tetratricopeptide repeat protein [Tahibacter sp.]